MKRLFDFECHDCGAVSEQFADADVRTIPCSCGKTMRRAIAMPTIALDGTSTDFPTANDHWANLREKRAESHRKKSYYNG